MKNKLLTILTLAGMFLSFQVFALDLHTARSQGLVGEKADGYVAAIKASPDVETLVREVNAKRQQEYARISKENGQPVDVVAKLAAGKVIAKLKPGQMYQDESGGWKSR
jgi:uncharacterized protein